MLSTGLGARRMALSNDGGERFAKSWVAWGLRDPVVEGSTVRVPGTNRLLFSHPVSQHRLPAEKDCLKRARWPTGYRDWQLPRRRLQ